LSLQNARDIARHQCCAKPLGLEGGLLLVDRTHKGSFVVVEHWGALCVWQVVLSELRRAASIKHGAELGTPGENLFNR
jgi:hypothetical protein